ncbi:TRAP transporter large permease subunit [Aeromicrobium sp. Leaf350]|uniref:TRAP transporter large permease n=1 Tax=Aeromicrobium sp. Leaf350 TaxID=2876565 RepID=UPI001E2BE7B5|nr:TRAP transporter large permease subunit [Aeromicrobium sp. Leaf350]
MHPRLRMVEKVAELLMFAHLLAAILLVAAIPVLRFGFDIGVGWGLEVTGYLVSMLVFLGSATAFHRGEHRSLRLLLDYMPSGVVSIIDSFTIWSSAAFMAVLGYAGVLDFRASEGNVIGLPIPLSVMAIPLIAGAILMLIYSADLLMKRPLKSVAVGGLCSAIFVAGLLFAHALFLDLQDLRTAFLTFLVVMLVLLLLGTPVAFCFGLASLGVLWSSDGLHTLEGMAGRASGDTAEFLLTAIPFFIAAGLLMESGDSTGRLISVFRAFLGHIRGGVAHTMVGSMYGMSGVSGSEAADVAAVGTVLREPMIEDGWSREESTGILIAACVMGATVPPSIGLIVVAAGAQISVGTLFIAGFLPALALGFFLFAAVYVRAVIKGVPRREKANWSSRARAVKAALFAFGLPLIVLGGIVGGWGTPTELSALAVLYVLVIEMLIHRSLRLRALWKVGIETCVMTGMIMFIVATASGFVHFATFASIPQSIGRTMADASGGSATVFLFFTVMALIPLGMLMEGMAALLVFPALLMPQALLLGVDPVHYAILMFIAVMIGGNLPPIGAGYYFAATILKADLRKALAPAYGYLLVMVVGLALLILVPDITLAVPRLFGIG